jgi:hypothetical protein
VPRAAREGRRVCGWSVKAGADASQQQSMGSPASISSIQAVLIPLGCRRRKLGMVQLSKRFFPSRDWTAHPHTLPPCRQPGAPTRASLLAPGTSNCPVAERRSRARRCAEAGVGVGQQQGKAMNVFAVGPVCLYCSAWGKLPGRANNGTALSNDIAHEKPKDRSSTLI